MHKELSRVLFTVCPEPCSAWRHDRFSVKIHRPLKKRGTYMLESKSLLVVPTPRGLRKRMAVGPHFVEASFGTSELTTTVCAKVREPRGELQVYHVQERITNQKVHLLRNTRQH